MEERHCHDAQENAAMLQIRAKAIDYRASLLAANTLTYAFYFRDRPVGIAFAQTESNNDLDMLIKRDPLFPYCKVEVTPVIDTEWLILEAQDFLKEELISPARAAKLVHPPQPADETMEYLLVRKEVLPFSPLLPQSEQDEIFRRTVRSQDAHANKALEFADLNPVGSQIGILIGCGSRNEVMEHVEHCEVYPDTVVSCEALLTLGQAFVQCVDQLRRLRRQPPVSDYFSIA